MLGPNDEAAFPNAMGNKIAQCSNVVPHWKLVAQMRFNLFVCCSEGKGIGHFDWCNSRQWLALNLVCFLKKRLK